MSAPLPAPNARVTRTRWSRLELGPRRSATSRKPAEEMGQPQDGAIGLDIARASGQPKHLGANAVCDLREPEDARLTGGTRSLMRRVLGLNVTQPSITSLRTLPAWVRKPALQ